MKIFGVREVLNFVKSNKIFTFLLVFAFILWLGILLFSQGTFVDEKTHYRQIGRILKGNLEILPSLTTFPGYHWTIAFLAKMTGQSSLVSIRFIGLLLSSVSLWIFFIIVKKIKSGDPFMKTLQLVFLPISFLYFPLVYTDIFSLLLVLLVFYFAISNKYKTSALFSLAAILVRQNNIIWIIFTLVYSYFSIYGTSFSLKNMVEYFRRTFFHLLIIAVLVIFFWLNDGVALGDKRNHQLGLYLGNSYFFLAVVGFLFLPLIVEYFHRLNFSKFNVAFLLRAGVGAILALAFVFAIPELHHGNNKLSLLRNIILHGAYNQYVWAYVVMILLGYCTFFLFKMKKEQLVLIPFIFASLTPSLLVEQRYYIVPLVFLLIFRKESSPKIELLLMIYFLVLSVALVLMIFSSGLFF